MGLFDGVLENPDSIEIDKEIRNRTKIATEIRQSKDLLLLSKRLVTISLDVPFEKIAHAEDPTSDIGYLKPN